MTNSGSNSYTQCQVNESGIESSSCATVTPTGSGALDRPAGIAYSKPYIYILNAGEDSNSYTKCYVGNDGIESSTCETITPTGNGALNSPKAITFNGQYAYITNSTGASYTQCKLGSSGIDVSTCNTVATSGPNALSNSLGIASSGKYVYATTSNKLIRCDTNANGLEFGTCTQSYPQSGIIFGLFGITFDDTYAYITNVRDGNYTQCVVADHILDSSSCITSPVGTFTNPQSIAVDNGFAYIITAGNTYTQCKVDNDGLNLSTCLKIIPSGDGVLNIPYGIMIH